MDWKVFTVIIVGLGIFFLVYQCQKEDRPDYDQLQAQKRAELAEEHTRKKETAAKQQKKVKQEQARAARGERPVPQDVALETDEFTAVFTTRGAALKQFTLKNPQYLEPPRNWTTALRDEEAEYTPVDLVTTDVAKFERNAPLRFTIYEGLDGLLEDADFQLVEQSEQLVVFRYAQPDVPVVITKKFELGKSNAPYQLWMTTQVTNTGPTKIAFRAAVNQVGYQHGTEAEGGIFSKQPNLLQGICRHNEEVYRESWQEIEKPFSGVGAISFAGVETNYFLNAMIPGDQTPVTCFINATRYWTPTGQSAGATAVAQLRYAEVELNPGQSKVFKIKNYLGPKRFTLLRSVGHSLEEAVDFGDYLWPICRVLLSLLLFFQSLVVNWGVAIILLTVMVKIVLMPLTHQSFKSADRMKALKPQVDVINEKYKDNPQEKQKAVMGLYKQNKVNPLGGCLPMLLQMPIWIALYQTLRTSPELYRAEFFGWITDLSSADPYFVTPIVMGALMFLQQRFTPMAGDAAQAKMMMYFMPVMFTAMMLFLPSGLTLYILVNTVLSIIHQLLIRRLRQKTA